MNKIIKILVTSLVTFLFLTTGIDIVGAYAIDNTYQLSANEGSSQRTSNRLIIAHETGVYASARNNAIYMKRTWLSNQAYVQYIVGDGGHVYRIGADGYVSWGAGSWGNANAPVQIELARTYDQATFNKDYAVYVNLLRDSARKYGISTNLDTGYGIVGHKWITDNVWGSHQDPYGYLASHGISKAQFAKDLKTGLNENGNNVPNKPSTPPTPPTNNNSGSYTFNTDTNVRNAPMGKIVAKYKRGQTVNYNSTVNAYGSTWMKYTSYSGSVRYVAMTGRYQAPSNNWHAERGTFKLNYNIIMRNSSPSVKLSKLATLKAGSYVKYDAYIVKEGYIWIRQPRSNGYAYLPTGQAVNGKRINYWGSFF